MATRATFLPTSAEYPASTAAFATVNGRPVLAFDASTNESAYWTVLIPTGWTGTKYFIIHYFMASATTGGVAFDVSIESMATGSTVDLDSATSFDSVNTGTDTVNATAGVRGRIVITLTNNDSSAADDYARVLVTRDTTNGSDTATGDCYLVAAELRDSA